MRRREFIAGLGAAGWPLLGRAQQQTKPVTGWLDARPEGQPPNLSRGFAAVWRSSAFQSRDVTVEYHLADGHPERLPAPAADLVRRRPAVIVAPQGFTAAAARAATRDTPIIFLAGTDLVEFGLVASLNRPGGNLTGVIGLTAESAEKARGVAAQSGAGRGNNGFAGRSRQCCVRSGGDQVYAIGGPYSRVALAGFQHNETPR